MNVLSIIKSEHREVTGLLDEVQKCEPGDERMKELASEIEQQLSTHLAIEERLFYSTLRNSTEDEEKVDMFEAYTEHEVAKHLIALLKSGRRQDELFKAELQVLSESVKHHVKEEESKVFKIAHEFLDQQDLDEMGEKWEGAKKRALAKSSNGKAAIPARKTPVRA